MKLLERLKAKKREGGCVVVVLFDSEESGSVVYDYMQL
jgi:hypothetical protein